MGHKRTSFTRQVLAQAAVLDEADAEEMLPAVSTYV
jgi:hypothetical protein